MFLAFNSNGTNSSLLEEGKDEEPPPTSEEEGFSEERRDEVTSELLQEGRIKSKERKGRKYFFICIPPTFLKCFVNLDNKENTSSHGISVGIYWVK